MLTFLSQIFRRIIRRKLAQPSASLRQPLRTGTTDPEAATAEAVASVCPEQDALVGADRQPDHRGVREAWARLPISLRRRLLSATDYVEVYCQGTVCDIELSAETEFHAWGWVRDRDEHDLSVELVDAPRSKWSPPRSPREQGVSASQLRAGELLGFTVGGMHRTAPKGSFVCAPAGWRPSS